MINHPRSGEPAHTAMKAYKDEGLAKMHPIRTFAAISVLAVTAIIAVPAPAMAGPIVDPASLTPAPPPGAVCRADGDWTICHTVFLEDVTNEPAFELPCGTVYQTSHDPRTGLRWYFDGLLVKRQVFSLYEGTWSLSPTGGGPTVSFIGRRTWTDVYTVPGDEGSAIEMFRGVDLKVFLPGGLIQIAGLQLSETEAHGVFRFPEDPEVADALCAVLVA
jgi:hypothetical protein